MLRSLFSGVSGMKNNQTKLDVIANNIANVNTTAFKSGRVRFQDILSQTIGSASPPMENGRGGINPRQIGLGMGVAGIDTITNQGVPQTTGRPLDCAIDGEGYFILSPDGGSTMVYSRDGAFSLDSEFNLVNSDGLYVLGYHANDLAKIGVKTSGSGAIDWTADDVESKTLTSDSGFTINGVQLQFDSGTDIGTVITTINQSLAGVKARLDGSNGLVLESYKGDIKVENATGDFSGITSNRYVASAPEGIGLVVKDNLYIDDGSGTTEGMNWADAKIDTAVGEDSCITINNRKFTFITSGTSDPSSDTYVVNTLQDIVDVINGSSVGVKMDLLKEGGLMISPANGSTSINIATDDADAGIFKGLSIDIDDLKPKVVGIPETSPVNSNARISSYSISTDGTIVGVYDDNSILNLGVISLAKFANPAGLIKIGSNNFTISNNSGEAIIGTGSSGGRGDILQSSLEMSNVDLASEFTDMIITSRAYQANSRSITTSDDMLQELLNLKR